MLIQLALNLKKVQNYAFFCPVSRLHLTLSNPVGSTDRITSNILRGLRTKSLIDVNGVVDLNTGEVTVPQTDGDPKITAPVTGTQTEDKTDEKKESVPAAPAVDPVVEKTPEEVSVDALMETKAPAPVEGTKAEAPAKKKTTKKAEAGESK